MKKTLYVLSLLVVSGFSAFTLSKSITQAQAATAPCIVTLFGIQYDVTPLQTGHPGGNIFACGTDMTATYTAQHGTDVTRMTPYLLPSTTPTIMPTETPTPTATPTVPPTVTPTVTPTVSPTITGVPSVSPTPSIKDGREHEEEKENEQGENHENEHHKDRSHRDEKNKQWAGRQDRHDD